MRYLAVTLMLVLVAAGIAQSAQGLTIPFPNLEMSVKVRVSPRALPRSTQEPVSFQLSAGITTRDGDFPPDLKELEIDFDRDAAIEVGGVPRCGLGGRAIRRTLDELRQSCGAAVVGGGALEATFAFPENTPISTAADMVVLNGGVQSGLVTLIAMARFDQPISTQVVVPIEIKRPSGPSGLRVNMVIPPLANGYGHLERLELSLARRLPSEKHPDGVFRLRCGDGDLTTDVHAGFGDGTLLSATSLQACKPKLSPVGVKRG